MNAATTLLLVRLPIDDSKIVIIGCTDEYVDRDAFTITDAMGCDILGSFVAPDNLDILPYPYYADLNLLAVEFGFYFDRSGK